MRRHGGAHERRKSGYRLAAARGVLGLVERIGNLLPDPIMIFVWLIAILMVLSAIGQAFGWSAALSYPGDHAPEGGVLANGVLTYTATSLFSEENIARSSPTCRAP